MANDNNKIKDLVDEQDDDPTTELEALSERACAHLDTDEQTENDAHIRRLMHRIDEIDAMNKLLTSELEFKNELIDMYRRDIKALQQTAIGKESHQITRPANQIQEERRVEPQEVRMLVGLNGDASTKYVIKSGTTSVGSSPDNDIQLKSNFVSRHHARIVSNPTDCVLGDLSSTNGTFVNSNRIKRHALREGDAISIGTLRFRYVTQSKPAPTQKKNNTEPNVRS